jgi:hypothetical protein
MSCSPVRGRSLLQLVIGLLAVQCARSPASAPDAVVSSANTPRAGALQTTGTHTYFTSFPAVESPISESGNWINGGSTGLDWMDVHTSTNKAFGTQSGNSSNPYNDSTALLAGSWGNDQGAQATAYVTSIPPSCCAEVELRLRSTMTAHNSTGYEFNCSVFPSNPYMTIVVWPGPLKPNGNDYPTVAFRGDMGCANGDVLGATAIGSTLTFYKNGEMVLNGTDTTFSEGVPGLGFFLQNPTGIKGLLLRFQTGISANYGFTNFAASDSGALPSADMSP